MSQHIFLYCKGTGIFVSWLDSTVPKLVPINIISLKYIKIDKQNGILSKNYLLPVYYWIIDKCSGSVYQYMSIELLLQAVPWISCKSNLADKQKNTGSSQLTAHDMVLQSHRFEVPTQLSCSTLEYWSPNVTNQLFIIQLRLIQQGVKTLNPKMYP